MLKRKSDSELAAIARSLITEIGDKLDIDLSVKLWDGSVTPLGKNAAGTLCVTIAAPGVIASLLKGPSLDKVIRHYIYKNIDIEGGTLFDIGEQLAFKGSRKRLKQLKKSEVLKQLLPFLLVPSLSPEASRSFKSGGTGRGRSNEQGNIQFHYDVSNEFYELFLDEAMVYSCAYFTDWQNSIDEAQFDKLDITCKKLRLQEGEKFLDIGCGWGSLLIHAAKHYGVIGHGVTLAKEQYEYALEQIEKQGLADKITIELKNYRDLEGKFDKIASIGMYEHVGIEHMPTYFTKVRSLLKPGGLFLNHGITRKDKKKKAKMNRPEQRAILKYIFPGGELDSVAGTIARMEQTGFEIQDVEGWRMHYQRTTELWCNRLTEKKEQAIAIVGEETYRIWVAYLAGVSLGFLRGSMRLYQTLATHNAKGPTGLPPTREDLYRQ